MRILLVDDDPVLRRVARRILAGLPVEIVEADGIGSALDLASQMTQAVDLLLTDVVMPSGSGVTLAGALREKWNGMRVLFMSGYERSSIEKQGAVTDAPFLHKPFTPATLRDAVQHALDGRA
jgi:CheY-like chemotaxis protein